MLSFRVFAIHFVSCYVATVESSQFLVQPASWLDTHCRLSMIVWCFRSQFLNLQAVFSIRNLRTGCDVIYTHYMSPLLKTGEVHTVSRYGKFMEKDHLEDLDVSGRKILKLILSRLRDLSGSKQRQMAGSCKHLHEILQYIKYGVFLDQLRKRKLLKKGSVWSNDYGRSGFPLCQIIFDVKFLLIFTIS